MAVDIAIQVPRARLVAEQEEFLNLNTDLLLQYKQLVEQVVKVMLMKLIQILIAV